MYVHCLGHFYGRKIQTPFNIPAHHSYLPSSNCAKAQQVISLLSNRSLAPIDQPFPSIPNPSVPSLWQSPYYSQLLQQMTGLHTSFFLWLNNTPLYTCATFSLFSHNVMNSFDVLLSCAMHMGAQMYL
jgi:hypothetical protein